MRKMRFGTIHADYVTMPEAIDKIIELAEAGRGGFVVTPNVDHVVLAERSESLQAVYADASLSLPDGMPLIWVSKLAGFPLPEKVSGSDIIRPLMKRAAVKGLRVYLLGAAPGVGIKAADRLKEEIPGLEIVGADAPPLGFEKEPAIERQTLDRMTSVSPDIVLMALGCPKQELLMHRWFKSGITPVMLGIGASLDFIAGKVKRAPAWMSSMGLEWVYRIGQDPKRLIKRYLVQDAAFLPICARMLGTRKTDRVFYSE